MRHLLIPSEIETGETLRLDSGDFHYLSHVLRLANGDQFDLLDAAGQSFVARITALGDDYLLAIAETRTATSGGTSQHLPVTIYQAMPKGQKFDSIIRQVIQAGATAIVPIFTERTVGGKSGIAASKIQRWQRIAREAVQQSGAVRPAVVHPPLPLAELKKENECVSLLLHPKSIAQQTLHGYLDRVPGRVELVVGPEGGFTRGEIDLLTDRGFLPLYLGPRVLRTETAAVFALGAVQILLQERGAWRPID